MNWILSPLKMTRTLFATGAIFTMCFTPLAEAKKAQLTQAQKVNMFLKETKLNEGGRTWGDYWRQVRHAFPQKTRDSIDGVVAQHRNEPMPKVEATTYKDANNKEQLRLTLTSKDGQVVNLTFTGDEQKPMKVNGVTLSKSDMFSFPRTVAKIKKDPQVAKLIKSNKGGHRQIFTKDYVLSYKEYKRLTIRQKAEYLYRMRDVIQVAQNVYRAKFGDVGLVEFNTKYEFVMNFLFGDDAYAAGTWPVKDGRCVNAGYMSTFQKNTVGKLSCAEVKEPNSTCGGDVTCNPMFYGYDSSKGGGNFCIPRSQKLEATTKCNQASPKDTAAQKKAIIESYMKKIHNKDFDEKALKEYYALSQAYLNDAATMCAAEPLASVREKLGDADRACLALQERVITLQDYAINPQPPLVVPAPVGGVIDCAAEYAIGSELQDDGKNCKCTKGEPVADATDKTGKRKICEVDADVFAAGAVVPVDADKEDDDDDCKYCWLWKPAALILGSLGIGYLVYNWLKGDDDDDDNDQGYITPIYPGTDDPTTPPTTEPDPECAPGTVRQVPGGPCLPTAVTSIPEPDPVTPTTPAGEGSGTGSDDILSGGTIQQR